MEPSAPFLNIRRSVSFAVFSGAFAVGFVYAIGFSESEHMLAWDHALGQWLDLALSAAVAAFLASVCSQLLKASANGLIAGAMTAGLFPAVLLLFVTLQLVGALQDNHFQYPALPLIYLFLFMLASIASAIGTILFNILSWIWVAAATRLRRT